MRVEQNIMQILAVGLGERRAMPTIPKVRNPLRAKAPAELTLSCRFDKLITTDLVIVF